MAKTIISTSRSKRFLRKMFLVRNIHTVGTSSTIFFQNVCQFVSFMASPKQPQSVTLLVMASTSVVTVKNSIISTSSHALKRRKAPNSNITPTVNSNTIRVIDINGASGTNHSKLTPKNDHAVKYSVILNAVPIGSTPFTNPEKINTNPTNTRAITFNVQFNFVSSIFIFLSYFTR